MTLVQVVQALSILLSRLKWKGTGSQFTKYQWRAVTKCDVLSQKEEQLELYLPFAALQTVEFCSSETLNGERPILDT